jgi:hypothetical protein
LRASCLERALLVSLLAVSACCTQRAPRRALPAEASEIREHSQDLGGGGDFTYWLCARLSTSAFEIYARSLGMLPHSTSRTYSDDPMWLSFAGDSQVPWWTPTVSLSGAWVKQEKRCWTYAKHEGGRVYLKALCH